MRTSQRSIAIALTLGFLAFSVGEPVFAGATSGNLRGVATLVRHAPTLPIQPVHVRSPLTVPQPGRRNFGPGFDGTTFGMVRTVLFTLTH